MPYPLFFWEPLASAGPPDLNALVAHALTEHLEGHHTSGRAKRSEVLRALSPQQEAFLETFKNLPDPEEMAKGIVDQTVEAMERNFATPIEGGKYILRLKGPLNVEPIPSPWDYKLLDAALSADKRKSAATIGPRVRGTFELVDKESGKVLKTERVNLGKIPTPMANRAVVVDGKPRYILHQWRRRPGVFTRQDEAGELMTEFNIDPATSSRVKSFKIHFDRDGSSASYKLRYGSSKSIDVWDMAKLLGAKDDDLRKELGDEAAEEILARATDKRYETNVRALYGQVFKTNQRVDREKAELELPELEMRLREQFNTTRVDKAITKHTLGVPADRVTSKALLRSFRRLQDVANGDSPDDRESIALKRIYSPADLIAESVGRESLVDDYRRSRAGKLRSLSDKGQEVKIKQLVEGSRFEKAIKQRTTVSMVQRTDTATNPLESFAQATATSILGEGAIGSEMAIPKDAKLLNPGSVGFLDPVHTPESSRAGVILNLPTRTRVVQDPSSKTERDLGNSMLVAEMLTPSGRTVEVSNAKTVGKVIGAFDQWSWEKGKLVPKVDDAGQVRGWRDGQVVQVDPSEVDFYLKDSGNLFDANSSLSPLLNSTAGGRVGYHNKQTVAAVPLVHREAPLVRTKLAESKYTNEELLAEEAGALRAAFDGTVSKVEEEDSGARYVEVIPKGKKKAVRYALPKNILMGGQAPLDSEIRVAVGDKVKRGDLLADSNFTKDGVMALGVNLRTGYLPIATGTFEDGVVVSESAAKLLTSQHLYAEEAEGENLRLGKKYWKKVSALELPDSAQKKLDDDGVIKVGERIEPGDLYMVGLRAELLTDQEQQIRARKAGLYRSGDRRGMRRFNRFYEKQWDHAHGGVVTKVEKIPGPGGKGVIGAKVQVRTEEPAQVGDKLFGRYANKATISRIIPDAEMPRNREGKHLELAYNPAAVTGRINPSQIYGTFLGKIARKTGKPEVIEAFGHDSNWQYVQNRLKEEGIDDGEELFDPISGRQLGKIGVGDQYILKAKQQVTHKATARGIGTFREDGRASKGKDGAQSIGELGVYGLLAQDAREFLRESQLYKSEDRPEVWEALRKGEALPAAQVPESFRRFRNYLMAAGININHDAERGKFQLAPMTDADVIRVARTNGQDNVIRDPTKTVIAGNANPERGGLFDPDATAGRGGDRWARFELSTRLPNPVYEGAIRDVLGLSRKDFEQIVAGTGGVKIDGEMQYGARAIESMLTRVDLKAAKAQAWETARSDPKPSTRSAGYRTLRTLEMLEKNQLSPVDAFMRKQVAVLPANMRDFKVDANSGDYIFGDVNYLYRNLALTDQELQRARKAKMPEPVIAELEAGLYDGMRELLQSEGSAPTSGADYQGLLGTITGRRPDSTQGKEVSDLKQSLLKNTLLQRRQILSGRTVIGPRDDLAIDEVGLPRSQAIKIFEPFVEAQWRKDNPDHDTTSGRNRLRKFRADVAAYQVKGRAAATPELDRILDRVAANRYIAIKRDPVLHSKGIQGFKPILSEHETLQLNPLVYSGFGADNDGDTMAIFAPITEGANRELKEKLSPKAKLFTISDGRLAYGLSHEAISGINRISRAPTQEAPIAHFKTLSEARAAFMSNTIEPNDRITVAGVETTYGRASINAILPGKTTLESLRAEGVAGNFDEIGLEKGHIGDILTKIAKEDVEAFATTSNELRKLGQESAMLTGMTLLMEDFKPVLVNERKKIEADLSAQLKQTERIADNRERQEAVRAIFDAKLAPLNKKGLDLLRGRMAPKDGSRPNVNAEMTFSKARVKPNQLQQVMFGPGAVIDGNGDVVATPVLKSYGEGLPATGYWATLHGARRGVVSKVIEVQDPGYLSKQVVNTAMDQVVTEKDCGTRSGISINLGDRKADLPGRFLAEPLNAGNKLFGVDAPLDGNGLSQLRQKHNGAVKVRSPMTCEAREGVCQKCVGALPNGDLLKIGENFGVMASQALGERSTQLTLSTFHSGGVYEPGDTGGARNLFQEASALLRMPGTMGGRRAPIAPLSGKVADIKRNTTRGGFDLTIQGDGERLEKIFLPGSRRAPDGRALDTYFQTGRALRAGEQLTEGLANPKEILETTGDIEQVRDYMVSRIGNLYGAEGVLQRNVEGVVRAITNTVEVADPGTTSLMPGEKLSLQEARRLEQEHKGGFTVRPMLKGIDVAPRELREDFMAQMNFNNLRRSLTKAAQTGASSSYHSTHPIPAMAYGLEFNRRSPRNPLPPKDGKY